MELLNVFSYLVSRFLHSAHILFPKRRGEYGTLARYESGCGSSSTLALPLQVRAVLLKSLTVWMSVRGHSEWVPKRASMYSGAYNTAPDTDALQQPGEGLPPGKRYV